MYNSFILGISLWNFSFQNQNTIDLIGMTLLYYNWALGEQDLFVSLAFVLRNSFLRLLTHTVKLDLCSICHTLMS